MCVCASSIALLHHDLIFENGSSAMAGVVAMCGVFVFTAAFVAQLAVYARIEDLPSIFGKSACSGSRQNCEAAYRARRFFMSNSLSASMWRHRRGNGHLQLPARRRVRIDHHQGKGEKGKVRRLCAAGVFLSLLSSLVREEQHGPAFHVDERSTTVIATLGALVAIFLFRADDIAFSDWETPVSSCVCFSADWELVLLYVSIPTAWFGGHRVGSHRSRFGARNVSLALFPVFSPMGSIAHKFDTWDDRLAFWVRLELLHGATPLLNSNTKLPQTCALPLYLPRLSALVSRRDVDPHHRFWDHYRD